MGGGSLFLLIGQGLPQCRKRESLPSCSMGEVFPLFPLHLVCGCGGVSLSFYVLVSIWKKGCLSLALSRLLENCFSFTQYTEGEGLPLACTQHVVVWGLPRSVYDGVSLALLLIIWWWVSCTQYMVVGLPLLYSVCSGMGVALFPALSCMWWFGFFPSLTLSI